MNELIRDIVYLLVGVSVLLVGMHFMSGGLKKIAGKGLKRFFKKTQHNPFLGMGIGLLITILIQSSDATSALVIGFINAGVMEMYQGLSIMLGGYIGTTITGILASFSSLSISVYLLLFAFVGTVMMFFSQERVKSIGEILCGLGLLFFGLAVMKDAFANADISAFCKSMFSSINFPPLLFLIGVVLAIIAQSSSAVTGIVIAMISGGALPLGSGLYIALGATLGTVTNTLLSSINGNVDGKRTAVIAFALRALTSIVAMVILWVAETPIVNFLHLMAINGSDAFPLAMFTVLYNIIFMPLLLPLLKPSIRLFTKLIKDKESVDAASAVQYIDDKLLKSPEVALMQTRLEIVHMFDLAYKNYVAGLGKIFEYTKEKNKEISLTEKQIDYLNSRITDFLIKLAPLTPESEETKIGAHFHVINDIERIGDHGFNFSEAADSLAQEDLSFSEAAKKEIKQMDGELRAMFEVAREAYLNKDSKSLSFLREKEANVHKLKQDFYNAHYERVLKDECSQKMTPYISSLIVELERIADHLTNIGYSIVNPTGDSSEEKQIARKKKRAGRK